MLKLFALKQKRNLLLIFISLAFLMFSNAVIELIQNRKDLYSLMENQSHTLLTSLMVASENSILAIEYLDDQSKERLFNNSSILKSIYESGEINLFDLDHICKTNDIESIVILNNEGLVIKKGSLNSNREIIHSNLISKINPLFVDLLDTVILGYEKRTPDGKPVYGIAVSTKENGAVYLSINAEKSFDFRKTTGFGPLIRKVAEDNLGIIYIAYQDSFNILAATGNITELEPITNSEFLSNCINDSVFMTRTVDFDSLEVFEAVHPFMLNEQTYGLLRIGLSTLPLKEINKRIYRRLIIISLALILIGFIILIYIFIQQQYSLLKSNYQVVETYSGKIIDNVSDAIIVLNDKGKIQIFNGASEKLFNIRKDDIESLNLSDILPDENCMGLLSESNKVNKINCTIGGELRTLMISKSSFFDKDSSESVILVFKDMTSELKMQKKLDRKERMTAMGELAAGVAHEIRNPLNTIGTIIQQLKKDFSPETEKEEYYEFTDIVYSEVERINNTVKDFLRFARPEPIRISEFKLSPFLNSLKKQYQSLFLEKNISFNVDIKWDGIVSWDENQIKQVFINLIQNSYDVLTSNGSFIIKVGQSKETDEIIIHVIDDGSGMNEKTRKNIFNLYFTTKAGGTGIGLSIVQRIIYEHGGFISVNSQVEKGTTFIIRLPVKS